MPGLFAGTSLERPVTCEVCEQPLDRCRCPRDARGAVLMPGEQMAVVRLERRAKGKSVTAVSGLDPIATDLPALLKTLKASCGAGGTIDQSLHMIEVQGDHRERIAALLRDLGFKVRS